MKFLARISEADFRQFENSPYFEMFHEQFELTTVDNMQQMKIHKFFKN